MTYDYCATEATLYVVRDAITDEVIGTWPATGPNAPADPKRTIAGSLAADPTLCRRPLRCRREQHLVCLETGALLT